MSTLDAILAKLVNTTGGTPEQVRAMFVGGDVPGFSSYIKALEASGYQSAGDFVDNVEWFHERGLTHDEFMVLVRASA